MKLFGYGVGILKMFDCVVRFVNFSGFLFVIRVLLSIFLMYNDFFFSELIFDKTILTVFLNHSIFFNRMYLKVMFIFGVLKPEIMSVC